MKDSQREALTDYRAQSERLVRTPKVSHPARGTHVLSSTERGAGQDSERWPASERHSPTVECRVRNCSEQRKKASQRGALTSCRAQSEGLVRTAKEGQPARGTHVLLSAERGANQGSE
jgi:hypothetical protein